MVHVTQTTPLSGIVCHPWHLLPSTYVSNLKLLSICTHYEDMKGDTKGRIGVFFLTDPRDAVPQAHRVVHRCRRPVYHTDRPTKFTTPQPISLSREIVGAHQNLNGSCDPNHASFRDSLPSMALATVNLRIKFEVTLYLHSLRRYERRYKMSNWGVLGHSRSLEIAPMNRAHTSSIIMSLSCTVSDI